jgi:hypothetical protein
MSEEIRNTTTVATTAMTLATPASGQLVTGVNVQASLEGVSAIPTARLRQLIDAALRKRAKELKAAEADLGVRRRELADACAAVPAPPAFFTALDTVRVALAATFEPRAALTTPPPTTPPPTTPPPTTP